MDIPERIEGLPVRAIARKAFLSRKNLRKVTVPPGVTEVGDWAFAYCDSLHTVRFAGREECRGPEAVAAERRMPEAVAAERGMSEDGAAERGMSGQGAENGGADCAEQADMSALRFGKSVFLECGSLRYLYVRDGIESTAALLAAAVTTAGAAYLLDAEEAGSEDWLEKWDARMLTLLHTADNEGYSKQVLCGEEDYGSTDLAAYENGQRKVKVRLLLLRLLYPVGLSAERGRELEAYLREHTKGCEHEETWQVVLTEHGEDRAFYELFAELGCINDGNFEGLLLDVGEEYPELKAYLMRYKEAKLGYQDFFSGLEL